MSAKRPRMTTLSVPMDATPLRKHHEHFSLNALDENKAGRCKRT